MTIGGLIYILIALVILGLIIYAIETLFPLPAPFGAIIRVIAVLLALVILLNAFGVVGRPFVVVGP
jgi:hypothetical protein